MTKNAKCYAGNLNFFDFLFFAQTNASFFVIFTQRNICPNKAISERLQLTAAPYLYGDTIRRYQINTKLIPKEAKKKIYNE